MFSAILYNNVHCGDTRVSPSREETRDDLVGTMADRVFLRFGIPWLGLEVILLKS